MERLTRQRKEIIESLKILNHATLNSIYSYLKKNGSSISLSTVYRNLNSLKHDDIIKELDLNLDESPYYELNMNKDHDHFICLKCKSIIDIPKIDSNKEYLKEDGNLVKYKTINEYGICIKCNKKEGKDEKI